LPVIVPLGCVAENINMGAHGLNIRRDIDLNIWDIILDGLVEGLGGTIGFGEVGELPDHRIVL
jgi:hypothetical protein